MKDKYTIQKILVALIAIQVIFFASHSFEALFSSTSFSSHIYLADIGEFVVSIAIGVYCYTRINKTVASKYKDLVLNYIAAMIAVYLFFGIARNFFLS